MIGLARGLKLPVLAEGVETEEQLAFLKKETCDEIQGYLIGRPLPIEDYTALTGQPESERPDKLGLAKKRAPERLRADAARDFSDLNLQLHGADKAEPSCKG